MMKGNFSRDSYQSKDRYSGVFQVQGGMVTDADLGEQARIARGRTDELGHDTAGSGVPVENGAVTITGDTPSLAEGVVYAEGLRGVTEATGALGDELSLYDLQVDFPLAPTLPNTGDWLLYADIWQRTVSGLEDTLLSDPGLHGAETALRQRTTTQIKFMPLADASSLGSSTGSFPKIGNGQLSVTPVDPETIGDDCDPCADVVAAEQTVANGLFRIEIVHVEGDAQSPDSIQIAWSDENAYGVAPATVNSEDFSRAGSVYEFFSAATEKHLGVHQANNEVARSSFAETLAGGPAVASAPEGGDWPFVRRWSGAADINFGTSTVTRVGGGSGVTLSGQTVTITVDAFTATLEFSGNAIVAGDYWLVETRRHGETPIRVVSASPVGIEHKYCPLFRISNGAVESVTDEENRRLSFPVLANLPATHVSFENNCSKLYEDAENVQEALDNLCGIEASDIAFDPTDCPRLYEQTDNVQDALINLCKADFGNEKWLRLLQDWGVICGVIPSLPGVNGSSVSYSAGAILDRVGEFGEVSQTTVDLNTLVNTEFFHFDNFEIFDKLLRSKDVCLALAIGTGGSIETHLCTKDRAFAPADPSFLSVFQNCLQQNKPFDFKDNFSNRPTDEQRALNKVVYGAGNSKLAASQKLNSREQQFARSYNNEKIASYKAFVNDEEEANLLDLRIQEIDETIKPEEATGEVRETRFMQREALVYRAINERDLERLRKCLCKALLPRCPTPGDAPYLVPIACLSGVTDNQEIFIREICAISCRKQAMSWRMVTYFTQEIWQQYSQRIADYCCPPPPKPEDIFTKVPNEYDFDIRTDLTVEKIGLKVDEGLRIVTGRKSPSDYRVKPSVDDLGIDQAKVELKGNGIEVVNTIDIGDEEAVTKIREASIGIEGQDLVLDGGEIGPGDKVALVVQDGVAIDYVKVETGAGKFLYRTDATANLATPNTNLAEAEIKAAELAAKIEAAKTATDATENDLSNLKNERDTVAAEVNDLSASITEIRNERTAAEAKAAELEARINTAKAETASTESELANLKTERDTLTQEVNSLSASITEIRSSRAEAAANAAELEALVNAAKTETANTETELTSLKAERDSLAAEVNSLGGSLAEIKAERTAVLNEINAAKTELTQLTENQKELLAATKKERNAMVATIRKETPITAVARGESRLTSVLAGRGITNLAELAELPDSELRELAAEANTSLTVAKRIQKDAENRINAPIQ